MPRWLNWIEHRTSNYDYQAKVSNSEVVGSSPIRGAFVTKTGRYRFPYKESYGFYTGIWYRGYYISL